MDCLLSVGSRLILRIMERYGVVNTVGSSALCKAFSFTNVLFLISGTGTLLFLCLERYIAVGFKDCQCKNNRYVFRNKLDYIYKSHLILHFLDKTARKLRKKECRSKHSFIDRQGRT